LILAKTLSYYVGADSVYKITIMKTTLTGLSLIIKYKVCGVYRRGDFCYGCIKRDYYRLYFLDKMDVDSDNIVVLENHIFFLYINKLSDLKLVN
jgi:hypothetical protein